MLVVVVRDEVNVGWQLVPEGWLWLFSMAKDIESEVIVVDVDANDAELSLVVEGLAVDTGVVDGRS